MNNRGALIVKALEHIHDFFALRRMKIAGRLVSQNQTRIGNHGARDSHQLLLSARQLRGIKIFLADNLKTIERVADD